MTVAPFWAQLPVGLLAGYLAGSLSESLQHRVFGHGSRRLRRLVKRIPALDHWLRSIYWSHTVMHHGRTFKKHFMTPFRSPEERSALLATLNPQERRIALRTNFGLTITAGSYLWFMWLPLLVVPFLFIGVGLWAAAISILPMLMPPTLSKIIHPLVHRPYQDVLRESKGLVRWLLRTPYGTAMIRHHWLHHRYPRYNFNLLLSGDWLLGTHRSPSEDDLRAMSALGIPCALRRSGVRVMRVDEEGA